MANHDLFSQRSGAAPRTDTENRAGGVAYQRDSHDALAQLACTGTFSDTFYASAKTQLDEVLKVVEPCHSEWIAKVAVYVRQRGLMKDLPAFLAAYLCDFSIYDGMFDKIAPRVLDNGRTVRNFVQFCRSGVFGRTAIPRAGRRYIQTWLRERKPEALFRDSVGTRPSIADIIKMVHPKPVNAEQGAFWHYLVRRERGGIQYEKLPPVVLAYEEFRRARVAGEGGDLLVPPDGLDFRMVADLPLLPQDWRSLALNVGWHALRMNLNTFARHGVWKDPAAVALCAAKLRNSDAIERARVMPYQLYTAYLNVNEDVPQALQDALQDAAEIATANVPKLDGRVAVIVDVSGSMSSSITGYRQGATSKMSCRQVAAFVAACVARKNEDTLVLPVDTRVHSDIRINPRDSMMTIASQLAINGGGTALGAAMEHLLERDEKFDLVWMISDNESWADLGGYWGGGTSLADSWKKYLKRFPNAKLVCQDIVANTTTQAPNRPHTLNVGGFSDAVFDIVNGFLMGKDWTSQIDEIAL